MEETKSEKCPTSPHVFPRRVQGHGLVGKAVQVCAGLKHSVLLDTDGHVWTCGKGVHGQLGLGYELGDKFEFTRVDSLKHEKVFWVGVR